MLHFIMLTKGVPDCCLLLWVVEWRETDGINRWKIMDESGQGFDCVYLEELKTALAMILGVILHAKNEALKCKIYNNRVKGKLICLLF